MIHDKPLFFFFSFFLFICSYVDVFCGSITFLVVKQFLFSTGEWKFGSICVNGDVLNRNKDFLGSRKAEIPASYIYLYSVFFFKLHALFKPTSLLIFCFLHGIDIPVRHTGKKIFK